MKPSAQQPSASVHLPASVAPNLAARSAEAVAPQLTQQPKTPDTIELTVLGAPPGARVWFDGKSLGEAGTPLAVPFAEAPLQLTVTAKGHEPASVSLIPNKAQEATVKLVKKRGAGAGAGAGAGGRGAIPSDLESPF
jgi:hypothetical protein